MDIEVGGRYLVFPIRLAGPTAYAAQPVVQKLAYLTEPVAEKTEQNTTNNAQPTKKPRTKKKAVDGKKVQPVAL